jgi:signal transduction histidine kinase
VWSKAGNLIRKLTLFQRFLLTGLVIMLAGMLGIGKWVEQQIMTRVVHNVGATTALYVDSFIAPYLQELGQGDSLSLDRVTHLSGLLQDSPMGQRIVAFKLWDTRGKLLYTTSQEAVGETYPMSEGLLRARIGEVSSEISELQDVENAFQGEQYDQLLETYSPVWLSGTDQIIAVAEFYQSTQDLERDMLVARRQSWIVVGTAIAIMYLLLTGFVRQAGKTIDRQQDELGQKVVQLTDLLNQNQELHDRVRNAAASVALLNESFLRRIGSELHDGPAQELGLSVLKLDSLIGRIESQKTTTIDDTLVDHLGGIQVSLQNALKEMRGIATGLSLPQLNTLSLPDTITRAVRNHERRTGTTVEVVLQELPEQIALPVKITVFRVLQEGLTNAFRHALGIGQKVSAYIDGDNLMLEISDSGPGFNPEKVANWEGHLGLNGMRERVESLSGRFTIYTEDGKGTRLVVCLPFSTERSLE